MRRRFVKTALVLIVISGLLSACFSPVKVEQKNTYVLNTLPKPLVKKTSHRINLMVMEPDANQLYQTTQMAYSTEPYKIAFFAKNSWAETPTQMLQSLLIQTLQDTHHFYSIGMPSSIGYYNYVLSSQLLHFEQRFYRQSSEVIVTLRVQITKVASNRVVATKQFTVIETAPQNTPYGGVVAANQAVAKVLSQVARFCLEHLH